MTNITEIINVRVTTRASSNTIRTETLADGNTLHPLQEAFATLGGAQMSEMHANFLINTGEATGHDLELLGETVRSRVLDTSGVKLEWEIRRIGTFAAGQSVEPFLGKSVA